MLRKVQAVGVCLVLASSLAPAAHAAQERLSAAQIVDKNVAARGGLSAWGAVRTLSFQGKLGAGGNQRATLPVSMADNPRGTGPVMPRRPAEEAQLPFRMNLERGRKLRVELQFNGQTAVQVFDGIQGWKVRPFLNRNEVEPYTAAEMKKASLQSDLDGPLIDYAVKGTRIELVGQEQVEGEETYKLKLTSKDGQSMHIWIDSRTFLETKMEGQPRRMDGTDHPVEVYFRDYRAVHGLQIPFVLETKVLPVARTSVGLKDTPVPVERITLEEVEVNPALDEALFSKPRIAGAASRPVARMTQVNSTGK
jgi:hypothetical protein